jgi:S-adenosylmethionine synthetase
MNESGEKPSASRRAQTRFDNSRVDSALSGDDDGAKAAGLGKDQMITFLGWACRRTSSEVPRPKQSARNLRRASREFYSAAEPQPNR